MISGFHTSVLVEHDLATAGAIVRQAGFQAVGMRLSLARLDPLADANVRSTQVEMAITGCRDLVPVLDADGAFLIDPWDVGPPSILGGGSHTVRRQEYLRAAIDLAAELRAAVLTFSVGKLPPGMGVEVALERLAAVLLELSQHAETHAIQLAVRPRIGDFVDSVGRFERLVQWLGENPWVGLAGDVGAMVAGGEMPVVDLLERVGDRLAAVYLSDIRGPEVRGHAPSEPLIGSGSVSARRVVQGLGAGGFQGPVVLEPSSSTTLPQHAEHFFQAVFG